MEKDISGSRNFYIDGFEYIGKSKMNESTKSNFVLAIKDSEEPVDSNVNPSSEIKRLYL